jgi:hypothetical protein
MAADGTWPQGGLELDEVGAGSTPPELRGLLAKVEARLSAPNREPLNPIAASQLAEALEALETRLDMTQADASERFEDLGGKLIALAGRLERQSAETARLTARLEARLDARLDARLEAVERDMADRLETAAAGRLPTLDRPAPAEPGPVRTVLLAAASFAVLSVAAATAVVMMGPQPSPANAPPVIASLQDQPSAGS